MVFETWEILVLFIITELCIVSIINNCLQTIRHYITARHLNKWLELTKTENEENKED